MSSEFGVSFRVIGSFFDRPHVRKACRSPAKRNLSKAGAFVRRAARGRIRKRKRSAEPGQSPSSHAGGLKDGILFGYDAARESVVIGPVRYNVDGGQVPALLEYGGQVTRRYKRFPNGKLIRARGLRLRRGEKFITKTSTYHAFPYMGPALQAEIPKFPELWSNSLHG